LVSDSEISLSSFWCSSTVLGSSFSLSFSSPGIWIVGFIFTRPLKDSAVLLQGGVRNGCIRSCLGSVFLAILGKWLISSTSLVWYHGRVVLQHPLSPLANDSSPQVHIVRGANVVFAVGCDRTCALRLPWSKGTMLNGTVVNHVP
jgi:hypothetical protein